VSAKTPELVDQLVAFNIRARRKQHEMSQEALAEELGVSFQQVQKYESGRNRVSAGRLWQIARALDVPVIALFKPID
jgi:transcriptional regulator with XRE-family HTH domain